MKDYGRREETAKVKAYLTKMGYREVKVDHGKGTAWGWLHVRVTISRPANCYCSTQPRDKWGGFDNCHHCVTQWQDEYSKLGVITREVTGRHGEYGGNINYSINQEDLPAIVPKNINPVLQSILAD